MKHIYESPMAELIRLYDEDVLTVVSGVETDENGDPWTGWV